MATSWLYSTFLLPSLLRLCGPQNGCAQINVTIPRCCCRPSASVRVDKTIYSYGLSDSTLSTSSTTAPMAPNIHNVVSYFETIRFGLKKYDLVEEINSDLSIILKLNWNANINQTDLNRNNFNGNDFVQNVALVNGEAHELEPLTTSSSRLATAKYRPPSDAADAGRHVKQIHFPTTALLAPDERRTEIVHIETMNSDMLLHWPLPWFNSIQLDLILSPFKNHQA